MITIPELAYKDDGLELVCPALELLARAEAARRSVYTGTLEKT